jgi:pentatricopeptide repeat protein
MRPVTVPFLFWAIPIPSTQQRQRQHLLSNAMNSNNNALPLSISVLPVFLKSLNKLTYPNPILYHHLSLQLAIRQTFFLSSSLALSILCYQSNQRRKNVPDHGENFVPGSESAPSNRNPQSLDHFKRGYRERAHLRDRDTSTLNEDFRRGNRGSEHRPPQGGGRYIDRNLRPGGYYNDRRSGGDRGDDRGRGQVIMGLDVQALVDRLCRNFDDVFKMLDAAKDEHKAVFQSGKAVTAIISNLARRRNLNLANIVWDWIDSAGIQKNTFHYNSMISVCEKVRDFRKALKLLDEMKEKKVTKNEVT